MTNLTRRHFNQLLTGVSLAFVAGGCSAEDSAPWREGEHYDVISPAIRVGKSDEVVVTEFFWYGCGHCYTFEPLLHEWEKTLPEGVKVEGSPAMWNGAMQLHARAFYVAQALGELDSVHGAIFKAMHVERNRLSSKEAIRAVFVASGVNGDDFDKVFDSFGIGSQLRQADARARSAKISGTPSMMVNGKYMISTKKAGSQENMLKVAEYLALRELEAKS